MAELATHGGNGYRMVGMDAEMYWFLDKTRYQQATEAFIRKYATQRNNNRVHNTGYQHIPVTLTALKGSARLTSSVFEQPVPN